MQAEQIHKIITVFNKDFAQLVTTVIFSLLEINHVIKQPSELI